MTAIYMYWNGTRWKKTKSLPIAIRNGVTSKLTPGPIIRVVKQFTSELPVVITLASIERGYNQLYIEASPETKNTLFYIELSELI